MKLKSLLELKNHINEQPTAVITEVSTVVASLNTVITNSKTMFDQVFNEIQVISGDENNAGKLVLHSNINVVLDQLSAYITDIQALAKANTGYPFERYAIDNSISILGDALVNKLNN